MEIYFVQILVFLAVFFLVLGLQGVMRGRAPARLAVSTSKMQPPWLLKAFGDELEIMGRWLAPLFGTIAPSRRDRLSNLIKVASLTDFISVYRVYGLQVLLAVGTAVPVFLVVFAVSLNMKAGILAAAVPGIIAAMLPGLWLRDAAVKRQEAISKALPYAIDLLTVAMEAGQDFGAAARLLVEEAPRSPLVAEFEILDMDTTLGGMSRAAALRSMADRIQLDEVSSFVSAVIQSATVGAALADTLRLQAEEARRRRFHKAERKAARAPSLLLFPVLLFIVPSVFIVVLFPIAMRMMGAAQFLR